MPESTIKQPSFMDQLAEIAKEQGIDISDNPPTPEIPPEPVPPPQPTENEPKIVQNPDGSSVTIEKTGKGWRATLDTGTGAKNEVFYGNTKEELMVSIATAKTNATRKIRELNRQIKLGVSAQPNQPAQPNHPAQPVKELTAEEKLSLQVQSQSDLSAAMDSYFEKRFGMTPDKFDEVRKQSERGAEAARNLYMEEVAKQFIASHPTYYSDDNNYKAIIGLLAKQKLNTALTDANQNQVLISLVDGGHYTVANLTDAFEELSDDGLLVFASTPKVPDESATPVVPDIPQPTVSPVPQPVATPPTDNTVRRPRAGFGLRTSETSVSAPPANEPPSDDDFDRMTDEQLAAALANVRREARKVRRF